MAHKENVKAAKSGRHVIPYVFLTPNLYTCPNKEVKVSKYILKEGERGEEKKKQNKTKKETLND